MDDAFEFTPLSEAERAMAKADDERRDDDAEAGEIDLPVLARLVCAPESPLLLSSRRWGSRPRLTFQTIS
jgi:hypothetical protein